MKGFKAVFGCFRGFFCGGHLRIGVLPPWNPTPIGDWLEVCIFFLGRSHRLLGDGATFREVTIDMAAEAFEGNMLVIQLLNVTPVAQGELKGLREPFLEIDLYTDAGTGVLIPFWFRAIQKAAELVSYVS